MPSSGKADRAGDDRLAADGVVLHELLPHPGGPAGEASDASMITKTYVTRMAPA